MQKLVMIVMLSCWSMTLSAQRLERVKISEEISMKVPASFINMSESERNQKYISSRVPIAMFTNEDRTVDIGINENSTRWGPGDLEILKDFYKANIMGLHNEVTFVKETIEEVADRQFIVFEFTSKVYKEDSFNKNAVSKYSYIQYTLFNEKVLLFNFTAPLRYRQQWEPIARDVMASVRIRP
ncbi:MAG: hypothetical protein AAGA85_07135 [Bacteroidota bacterium]